jgi:protocatechuate 3,4-dioxygenase beta subunit
MQTPAGYSNRRNFLGALGAAVFATRGAFAEQLIRTPSLTEGPFYPDRLPLDTDNDLLVISDSITPAVGEVTHLTGRVLGPTGSPVKGLTVEIWQCDANAVYLHSADSGSAASRRDKNFQGFGRFVTGESGAYRFRTIKPIPYPGRPAPHIHVKVKRGDRELLTTQIFVNGHPGNESDGVFLEIGDPIDQELVLTDFRPLPGSRIGELAARFDIVLGRTPDERTLKGRRAAAS